MTTELNVFGKTDYNTSSVTSCRGFIELSRPLCGNDTNEAGETDLGGVFLLIFILPTLTRRKQEQAGQL